MHISRRLFEPLIFGEERLVRFTQDSPVMPDVWFAYAEEPAARVDLLLVPKRGDSPAKIGRALSQALSKWSGETGHGVAYNETHVVARLTFDELALVVLPWTGWWRSHVVLDEKGDGWPAGSKLSASATRLEKALSREPLETAERDLTADGRWLLRLVGAIEWARSSRRKGEASKLPTAKEMAKPLGSLLRRVKGTPAPTAGLLWSVNKNRDAMTSTWRSVEVVKADAARRVFTLKCTNLCWAVLDTGIDARHPAFRKRDRNDRPLAPGAAPAERSRIRQTFDFTRIRDLLDPTSALSRARQRQAPEGDELRARLQQGRAIDWSVLMPMLTVSHDATYVPPRHPHGTHVAGILAGDWRQGEENYDPGDDYDLKGVCPDLELYDLRVLGPDGKGDEFAVIAALQFVRYLNEHRAQVQAEINGCNVSLSILHDVSNYACGRTPVCEEAERVVASGVVVVASAGNEGYVQYLTPGGRSDAYRNISITDPGNADGVITVGATHRQRPHTYGVSYFSSRGPTGDGRVKPDVVAPGEKIKSPVPGGRSNTMDGTSMAAPHVSGAAALLMSRHRELTGNPGRIKRVLCETATDLARERYFQGAGLVDILRAIQAV